MLKRLFVRKNIRQFRRLCLRFLEPCKAGIRGSFVSSWNSANEKSGTVRFSCTGAFEPEQSALRIVFFCLMMLVVLISMHMIASAITAKEINHVFVSL